MNLSQNLDSIHSGVRKFPLNKKN